MTAPVGNAVGKVLGLAGAGVAAWFAANSTKGRAIEWQRKVDNHHADLSLKEAEYNHFHYSGEPAMDSLASKLKHRLLFGPLGINTLGYKIKTYTEGFVNDVLLRNFIPIAAGVGGLYATGFKPHRLISEPFKYLRRILPPPQWDRIGNLFRRGGKQVLKGFERVVSGMSKNPGVALALGALGAFGIYRFNRVWDHTEAHDFYGTDIYGGGSH